MTEPPHYVIEAARQAAIKSPCQKSKRGVAIFNPETHDRFTRHIGLGTISDLRAAQRDVLAGAGFNGPPPGYLCDGSVACRRDCAKFCLHAEHRAIRAAGFLDDVRHLELVHVKLALETTVRGDKGEIEAGGPPTCWQCSKEILDVGLRGVWLYEKLVSDDGQALILGGAWRFYTAHDFHNETLKNCDIAGALA